MITLVGLITVWAGRDSDGTVLVSLISIRPNEFLPGDDQGWLSSSESPYFSVPLRWRLSGSVSGASTHMRLSLAGCQELPWGTWRILLQPPHQGWREGPPEQRKERFVENECQCCCNLHQYRMTFRNFCDNCSDLDRPVNRSWFLHWSENLCSKEEARSAGHRTSCTPVRLGGW